MASDAEPAKLLLPYLQRADELQKHEPLVAYYCRLYAMEKGLKIPQKDRTKTTNALLISLMNQLEKDKKSVTLGPEDSLYVEGFASNVFAKADKQDRAGRADLNTAKTFYAASIFFEILFQFGELQPDIEQKQKYAVWKAAEIRKALKEGRRPVPGPPGDDKDLTPPTSTYDIGRSESLPTVPPVGDAPLRHPDKDLGRSESFPSSYPGAGDVSSQHTTNMTPHSSTTLPPSYSSQDYPSSNFHHLPPPPETHHHQSYSGEQQSPLNYHPTESSATSSFSYPNFQTYPSFHDATFPPAPSHEASYYQGPDTASYSQQSVPPAPSYPSAATLYGAGDANGNQVKPSPAPSSVAAAYVYDCNYQPSVEKITDAHKAARFAVGALAFDDVPVAVDFLRKALELLTNPSAEGR